MPRSDPRQLDLFRCVDVVLFPINRRVDLYRPLTTELLALPLKADRDRIWRSRTRQVESDLRAIGMRDEDISRELLALRTRVGCEARRRIHLAIARGEAIS